MDSTSVSTPFWLERRLDYFGLEVIYPLSHVNAGVTDIFLMDRLRLVNCNFISGEMNVKFFLVVNELAASEILFVLQEKQKKALACWVQNAEENRGTEKEIIISLLVYVSTEDQSIPFDF